MLPRPTVIVSLGLLGSLMLAQWVPAQGSLSRGHSARITDLSRSVAVVLDGIVLEPDGSPAAGAVVVSSAGGEAVTDLDGRYRLEVPLEAESVELMAAGDDSDGGSARAATMSVGLGAAPGTISVATLVLALGADCRPRWLPTLGSQPGVNWGVNALTVFDDGSGPALFAGGTLTVAGGVAANYIAKWDGSGWTPLGSGTNDGVSDLAVFDDGNGLALYAGGHFDTAGGVAVNHIAKWNGSTWSALGSGTNSSVYALAVFDDGSGPALYAGGLFFSAGGAAAKGIAKWDGSSWSPVGSGITGTVANVYSLCVFDDGSGPALYAGGNFGSAGGMAANNIARWNGSSWSALGSGLSGFVQNSVLALAVFDAGSGSALYAGGHFDTAGGTAACSIAKWDGSSWSALGSGVSGFGKAVGALAVHDDGGGPALYVGGDFWLAGGAIARGFARWDGANWATPGGANAIGALATFDDGSGLALFAGGSFTIAGETPANRIAKWNGSSWEGLSKGTNGEVRALTVHDDGAGPALYVGGSFTTVGGLDAGRIARWNGSSLAPLGSGMDGHVQALATFDDGAGPALYAGGTFTSAGGVPADYIAKWDGSSWSPLADGMNHHVNALAVFDAGAGPALYSGSSGAPHYIARWNGTSWSAVSGGMDANVYALTVFDDGGGPALYAAGAFTSAGGLAAEKIARWNGASWSPLGLGLEAVYPDTAFGYALAVHDDGGGPALYVGGRFTSAGGLPAENIARWDGSSWSALPSAQVGTIRAFAVFDYGDGPALYAGGNLSNRLAEWDGSSWMALGSGLGASVMALTVFDDGQGSDLYVGGSFLQAFDTGDSYLTRWGCPTPIPLPSKARRR